MDGEIKVTTARSLGRNEITTGFVDEPVTFYRASDPPLFAGLRQHWIDGTDIDTGAKFDLAAGAGMGSKYLTLAVDFPDGTTVHEYVDITEVLTARVAAIIAEHTAEKSR